MSPITRTYALLLASLPSGVQQLVVHRKRVSNMRPSGYEGTADLVFAVCCVQVLSSCSMTLAIAIQFMQVLKEKGRDLTQSYDKSPYTNRNVKRAKWQHKQRHKKSSIKQRLRTDLGRSVGVTKANQLVWLTGLRAHLPTNRNSRLIKRKPFSLKNPSLKILANKRKLDNLSSNMLVVWM